MRSRVKLIAGRVVKNLEQSGTPVVLAWRSWPGDSVVDPVTQVRSGTPAEQRETIMAFMHFVAATSAVRQFNEIQIGDCILDISPNTNLTGRDGLVFLLPTGPDQAMEQWTSKPLSSELSAMWDTMQHGTRLFQTVLVRKGT